VRRLNWGFIQFPWVKDLIWLWS